MTVLQAGLRHTDGPSVDPLPSFPAVLAAARAGEPWACTRLYEDLKRPVLTYVRLRGARDPDDVTSEVFLGVFRGLAAFSGDAAGFRAWVFTIARRRVVDDRRARGRRPREVPLHDTAVDPVGGDVEDDALRWLGDDRVAAMLTALTPSQREVVLLRVVADLPLDHVASVTGRSVGAVKVTQHRALRALRRSLEGDGVTLRTSTAMQWLR